MGINRIPMLHMYLQEMSDTKNSNISDTHKSIMDLYRCSCMSQLSVSVHEIDWTVNYGSRQNLQCT